MDHKQILELKDRLTPALKSKQYEFKMIGYKDISIEDIWNYLFDKVWKTKPEISLHQIVQDILHLPIHVYMSHLALLTYHIDNDDLKLSIQAVTNNEKN